MLFSNLHVLWNIESLQEAQDEWDVVENHDENAIRIAAMYSYFAWLRYTK